MGLGKTVNSHQYVSATEYSYKTWTDFRKQLLEDSEK